MKKKVFWKILTITLVFALAACDTNDADNSGGGGSGSGGGDDSGHTTPGIPAPGGPNVPEGSTLTLSGPVYEFNEETFSIERFTGGTRAIYWDCWYYGGVVAQGEITNGQLSFTIETPTDSLTYWDWDDGRPNDDDARFAKLLFVSCEDDFLFKGNIFIEGDETAGHWVEDNVIYVYADRPVTITELGAGIPNIPLRQGWNAITIRSEERWSPIYDTWTSTFHSGITPGSRWILEGVGNFCCCDYD